MAATDATQTAVSDDRNPDFANYAPGFANRFRHLPGARSLVIASGLAVAFATIAGPFHTGQLSLAQRCLFWTLSIGAVALAWRCWFALTVKAPTGWVRATILGGLLMTAAMPLVVMVGLAAVGRRVGPNWWAIWPQSLGIALVIAIAIYIFAYRRPAMDERPRQGRLWRHGVTDNRELLRVEAEDHYLRLVLADGRSLLVHDRFASLTGELDMLDGCVVRRGRWVAAANVAAIERDGRRLIVRTRDGEVVPVSAAGRDAMRQRAWI